MSPPPPDAPSPCPSTTFPPLSPLWEAQAPAPTLLVSASLRQDLAEKTGGSSRKQGMWGEEGKVGCLSPSHPPSTHPCAAREVGGILAATAHLPWARLRAGSTNHIKSP